MKHDRTGSGALERFAQAAPLLLPRASVGIKLASNVSSVRVPLCPQHQLSAS